MKIAQAFALTFLAAAPAAAETYEAAVGADLPVAWWRFEETAGTNAADSAGGTFPGQYANVALGQASAAPALGYAGVFNGVNSSVYVPDIGTFTNLSLEAWIRFDSLPPTWSAIYNTDAFAPGKSHWQVVGSADGSQATLEWALGFADLDNDFNFTTGPWYHVVSTYDAASGSGLLYLNGALVQTLFTVPGLITELTEGQLGSWDAQTRFLNGALDEVAVYGTALSAERVLAHYTAAAVPPGAAVGVPEPGSAALVLAGMAGIAFGRRRRPRWAAATA